MKLDADHRDQDFRLRHHEIEAVDNSLPHLRIQHLKRCVLQLVLQAGHTNPLSERCKDIHCFAGNAPSLLFFANEGERPHVVCAVRKLDQQHPNILAHRQQQFPKILGLRRAWRGLDGYTRQFCHAINQLRNISAKLLGKRWQFNTAILHRVVQQGGDDGINIKAHIDEQICDRNRMCEIGLTRGTQLTSMCCLAKLKGALKALTIDMRVVTQHSINQWTSCSNHVRQAGCGRSACTGIVPQH